MSRAASVLARASHLRGAPSINRLRYEAGGRSAIVAQAGAALLLSVLGGAVIAKTGDWQVAAALLGGATFVALGMLQPAVFLTALLVVRPLLDGLPGDPGQLLGLALIGVCALVVTSAPQLVRPTATWAFSILLIVSALACLPAFMEFPGLIGLDPIEELVRLAALFAMYFLAAQLITTPPVMRRIIVIVGLSGVGPALWALGELARSPTVIAQLGLVRVSGSFVNPVALSSYLALCILILLSLPRGDVSRWVRWPAVGVMTAALVVSYGREGWAFLLVGIILLHWRTNKRLIAGVAIASTALVRAGDGIAGGEHVRLLRLAPGQLARPADRVRQAAADRLGTGDDRDRQPAPPHARQGRSEGRLPGAQRGGAGTRRGRDPAARGGRGAVRRADRVAAAHRPRSRAGAVCARARGRVDGDGRRRGLDERPARRDGADVRAAGDDRRTRGRLPRDRRSARPCGAAAAQRVDLNVHSSRPPGSRASAASARTERALV
jgi:hypothetical protein